MNKLNEKLSVEEVQILTSTVLPFMGGLVLREYMTKKGMFKSFWKPEFPKKPHTYR